MRKQFEKYRKSREWHNRILCSFLIGVLGMTACSPKDTVEPSAKAEQSPIQTEAGREVGSPAETPASVETGMDTGKVYECEKVVFEKDTLEGALYQPGEVVSQGEFDLTDKVIGGYTTYSFRIQGGEYLNSGGAYFNYAKPLIEYLLNCLRKDETIDSYNLYEYPGTGDLSFMTMADALTKVKDLLNSIGVVTDDTYESYVLTADLLRQEEESIDMDGNEVPENKKEQWTEDDECYFFRLSQSVEGLDITAIPYSETDSIIDVIYGKQGFVMIDIRNAYHVGEQKKEEKLLTEQEVERLLEKDQELLIGMPPIEIHDMDLVLVPFVVGPGQMELQPAWRISVTQEYESVGEMENTLFYNAITGKEIV